MKVMYKVVCVESGVESNKYFATQEEAQATADFYNAVSSLHWKVKMVFLR